LQRRQRDLTLTLPEYLAQKAAQEAAGALSDTDALSDSPGDEKRTSGLRVELPAGNQVFQDNSSEPAA
jgi:hypothetical protein